MLYRLLSRALPGLICLPVLIHIAPVTADTLVLAQLSDRPKKDFKQLRPMAKYVASELKSVGITRGEVRLFSELDELTAAVKSGEADAALADKEYLVPEVEAAVDLVFVGDDIPLGGGIGMAFRKSDPELRGKFDAAVGSMKADGTLENGCHDINLSTGQEIHVAVEFKNGKLLFSPNGGRLIAVGRYLDGDDLIWQYGPFKNRLRRLT